MNQLKEGPSFEIDYRAVWYQVIINGLQIIEMGEKVFVVFKDYLTVTPMDFVAVSSTI
jgi:hypothetical protein